MNNYAQQLENLDFIMRFQSDQTIGKFLKPFSIQDWNAIQRPPIECYIPQIGLDNLRVLVNDPAWMNKTAKKKKEARKILKQFGLTQIAAGTNRMCFGCEYDPGIVFKLGLDRVGRSDNLAESYNQYFLNGFGAKIIHVLPDGILGMCERVQTMDQKTYAEHSDIIYRLITYWSVCKNILIEDIGCNFFKNWGVRLGFGPVLLDYPYVYKVSPFKLVCHRKDPITQQECMGHIDYDPGLNQIVCDRCGVRYGISDIADMGIEELVKKAISMKGKVLSMALVNTNVKVSIKRGNKIVNRLYNESDNKLDKNNIVGGKIVTSKKIDNLPKDLQEGAKKLCNELTSKTVTAVHQAKEPKSVDAEEVKKKHYHFYPRAVKNDIIYFLKRIERIHGVDMALELADRLQIKYNVMNYEQDKQEEVPSKEEKTEDIKAEEHSETKQEEKVETKEETVEEEPVVIGGNKETAVSDDGTKETDKPKDGLFVARALTAAEIEAMNQANSKENAIMGFPGEPLVDTMKFKELMPRIQELVVKKFDNFAMATQDIDDICNDLSMKIKDYIYEDVKSIMQGDVEALKVDVVKTVDTRNKDCYSVKADNRGTELFDILLYPKSDEDEASDDEYKYDELIADEEKLNEFFDKTLEDMGITSLKKTINGYEDINEAKNDMIGLLFAALMDTRDKNINYGLQHNPAMEAAKKYVEENYNFTTKEVDAEATVADEL